MKYGSSACILFFLSLFLSQFGFGQTVWSEVAFASTDQLFGRLQSLGLSPDHYRVEGNRVILSLPQKDIDLLQEVNFGHTIVEEDIQAAFLRKNRLAGFWDSEGEIFRSNWDSNCLSVEEAIQTPKNFREGSMGGYLTWEEMNQDIDRMVAAYPHLISDRIPLGKSIEGRPLFALKISDAPLEDEGEPRILYTALHHAREPMSMHQLLFFMWYLLENYATDPEVQQIVDHRALYFIPCVNPDGYVYNQQIAPGGGGLWRKNRRPNADGSFGVDLNRNYAYGWGADDRGSSDRGSSETYRGTAPFSEPETQAIRSLAQQQHFSVVMDYHSYGNFLIQPISNPQAPPMPREDELIFEQLGRKLTHYNCYQPGTDQTTVGYLTNGVSADWHYGGDHKKGQKTIPWIPEVGRGFWPAKNWIIPYAKENLYQNMAAALAGGAWLEVEEQTEMGLREADNQLQLYIRSLGLFDEDFTIALRANAFIRFKKDKIFLPAGTMKPNGSAKLIAIDYEVLPGLPESHLFDVEIEIHSASYNKTIRIRKMWQPEILSDISMEDPFRNLWITNGFWDIVADQEVPGNKVLTDSPGSNYFQYSNFHAMLLQPIDLSNAEEAFLDFRIKYKLESCRDQLFVEIGQLSEEGIPLNFQPVCGSETIVRNINSAGQQPSLTRTQPGWKQIVFDLKEFAGQKNLLLRFRLNTDPYNELDGVFIDDLKVIQRSISGPLPVELLSFEGVLNVDESVDLLWSTASEQSSDYFVVERSSNGLDFDEIGQVKAQGDSNILQYYAFRDENPDRPLSYYRLAQVDLDGSREYSPVITINLLQNVRVHSIFPNPVADQLHLAVESEGSFLLHLALYNALGQKVLAQKELLTKGQQRIFLDLSHLPKGLYFLKSESENLQFTRPVVKS